MTTREIAGLTAAGAAYLQLSCSWIVRKLIQVANWMDENDIGDLFNEIVG